MWSIVIGFVLILVNPLNHRHIAVAAFSVPTITTTSSTTRNCISKKSTKASLFGTTKTSTSSPLSLLVSSPSLLQKTSFALEQEERVVDDVDNIVEDDHDDDDERDTLVDKVTEKINNMEGLWYSDDFYGMHGREWVQISARLIGSSATSAMVATKVTGDPHVPAGCVTWQTMSWPIQGGNAVPTEIQIRADPKDPDGFSWLPGELCLVSKKEIYLVCQYTRTMKSGGTFYKQSEEEEEE